MNDQAAALRADARPLVVALCQSMALGAFVGTVIGGAYWAGGAARDQVAHSRIQRLAGAATAGFSDQALHAVAARQDPAALALAQRQDSPGAVTLAQLDLRTRRLDALDERLRRVKAADAQAGDAVSEADAQTLSRNIARVAARPFHLEGALGQSRDLDCLADAVYYEARGESAAGQAAIAQVVLNRVRHPAFPKTVCGVVFQHTSGGCQFSFACNGAMDGGRERGAWDRARKVAASALGGSVMADVGNATHFQARSAGFGAGLLKVAQVGAHAFFRFGGRAGAPSMFHAEAQPSSTAAPDPAPRTVIAGFFPLALRSAPKPEAAILPPTPVGPVAEAAATAATKPVAPPPPPLVKAAAAPAAATLAPTGPPTASPGETTAP